MVQDLASLALVEFEVGVSEMYETDSSNEEQKEWVVTLTLRFERVITKLVTVRLVVDVVLLFE
jgi:hypothetical protein